MRLATDPFWSHVDQLFLVEREKELDPEIVKYLEGVTGAVEANSFEYHCIWERLHGKKDRVWKSEGEGRMYVIGELAEMPITIQLRCSTIDERRIVFYEAPSTVVDHRIVRAWLEKYLPQTARDRNGHIHHTDANNWPNVVNYGPRS